MLLARDSDTDFCRFDTLPSPSGLGAYIKAVAIKQLDDVAVHGHKLLSQFVTRGTSCSNEDRLIGAIIKVRRHDTSIHKWKDFVMAPGSPVDVDSLTDTVDGVLDVIEDFGPEFISLHGLSAEKVNGEHLAALLRASSTWQTAVPGWDEALEVAKESLLRSGQDPEDALYGMI